jgi:Uma2 family endonuclease
MGEPQRRYEMDPDDPRAPTEEAWEAMTEAERASVLEALPSGFPISEATPPEGDFHFEEVVRTRDVLRRFFGRSGRRVYIGNGLQVYYPDERVFSPDLIAVLDVEPHARNHWTVSAEGKGLDLAMEIVWAGSRAKDLRINVERYARLGIPEYFVYDRRRVRLYGYRLAAGARTYLPILPQRGAFRSEVLDLELGLEGEKLRFFMQGAPLPEAAELIARLETAVDQALSRADEEARRASEEARRAETEAQRASEEAQRASEEAQRASEEAQRAEEAEQRASDEAQRAETEAQRAEEAERRLREALAELERLRKG